jgi:PAP2 superfamily protein
MTVASDRPATPRITLVLRAASVILALVALLYPANGATQLLYPIAFGLPLAWSAARARDDFRWWSAYVGGFLVFVLARNLADDLGRPVAYAYPIAWERAMFGLIPCAWLQSAVGLAPPWPGLARDVYLSYFLVPPIVVVALWRWRAERFRHIVRASLLMWASAVAWHMLVPTAPPWLAAERGMLPGVVPLLRHAGITAYGEAVARTNPVAAMPSVHMGAMTLLVWAAPHWWRALAAVYASVMLLAIVYLGDHYVVDGFAGIVLASVAWRVAR